MAEEKKYKNLEPVLNKINGMVISLEDDEKSRHNTILKAINDVILKKLREKDGLFKEMSSTLFYGGSYYDGLRVGKPNEFDLDLLLKLPRSTKPVVESTNSPGFVNIKLSDYKRFLTLKDEAVKYKNLSKLINDKEQLDRLKTLGWMERVVTLAMNDFKKDRNLNSVLETDAGTFYVKSYKSGPAFTLKVIGQYGGKIVDVDVDLVPCFIFEGDQWPKSPYRQNPTSKPNFFVVPKGPKNKTFDSKHYWRLSFQEQERIKINGKNRLKPTIKMLKKIRDTQIHVKVASYYIKTVLLWECDEKNESFWNQPLSYIFMTILKVYRDRLVNGSIPYYWNKNNNLLDPADKFTFGQFGNRITYIINDIERHLDEPETILKYLLTSEEQKRWQAGNATNNALFENANIS